MSAPVRPIPSLDLARRLVALGLSVIPTFPWDAVKPAEPGAANQEPEALGKKAGIKWKPYRERRATDEDLRAWFGGTYGSKRNVAIVCGPLSGVVVVDADSAAAVTWCRAHLPATPWEVTTGKGLHLYYRHPGVEVSNKVRFRVDGQVLELDLRGDRGYVLAPGSVHPSGRIYEKSGRWGREDVLPVFDPAWFPEEPSAAAAAPPPAPPESRSAGPRPAPDSSSGWALDAVDRAWRFMRSVPPRAKGEGRNDARFRLACALVRGFNLPDDETFRALQDWNARCPGGVSDEELLTSIRNAHQSGKEAYGARLAEAPRVPLRGPGGEGGRKGSAPGGSRGGEDGPAADAGGPPEPPEDIPWGDEEPPAGGRPWDHWDEPLAIHKGEPRRWAGNLAKILRQDRRWGRRLALNEMTQEVMFDAKGDGELRPVTEHFADRVQEAIENAYGLSFARDEVATKIRAQAVENPYHPVRRYLQGLPEWDQIDRIEFVPEDILGTKDPMARVFMRRFMIGAVRRALRPGCKLDTAVVLVGAQGKRKSTFFRTLAGAEFFSDTPVELDSKDRFFQVNAAWIVEMAEIDGMNSTATAESVKAFLSSQKDTFRPPYARTPITLYRSSVCVGTTNKEDGFLHDATGSRRFWPIHIDLDEGEEISVEVLGAMRDQLWAEAVAYERDDEPHWLAREEEDRRRELAQRFEAEDALEGVLEGTLKALKKERLAAMTAHEVALAESHASRAAVLLGRPGPSSAFPEEAPFRLTDGWHVGEILIKMNIPASQHSKSLTQRVTGLLRKSGWARHNPTLGGKRCWRWYDPADLARELAAS